MGSKAIKNVRLGIVALDGWMGGVVYTHNLIKSLSLLPLEERPQVTLFCKNTTNKFKDLLSLVNKYQIYNPWLENAPSGNRIMDTARRVKAAASIILLGDAQPELSIAARRSGVDVLFSVSNPYTRLSPPAIAWIPDLQHRALPHLFSSIDIQIRDRRFNGLLKRKGQHVVFSSQSALNDAIKYYGEPVAQTHILHFATVKESEWADDPAPVINRYQLPDDYVIVCNQFWKHKDHQTAFEAINLLAREGKIVNLVCTGETSDYRSPDYFPKLAQHIKQLGIDRQIKILGIIPRYDQIMLIRGAKCILQPSLFEGWSTVLEDARVLNRPIVASDIPVHVEQDLPQAFYFEKGDPVSCSKSILQVLESPPHSPKDNVLTTDSRSIKFARDYLAIISKVLCRYS